MKRAILVGICVILVVCLVGCSQVKPLSDEAKEIAQEALKAIDERDSDYIEELMGRLELLRGESGYDYPGGEGDRDLWLELLGAKTPLYLISHYITLYTLDNEEEYKEKWHEYEKEVEKSKEKIEAMLEAE